MSPSRQSLILVEGERTIGDEYKKVSRENNIANVKNLFAKWGKKVRMALDKGHGK